MAEGRDGGDRGRRWQERVEKSRMSWCATPRMRWVSRSASRRAREGLPEGGLHADGRVLQRVAGPPMSPVRVLAALLRVVCVAGKRIPSFPPLILDVSLYRSTHTKCRRGEFTPHASADPVMLRPPPSLAWVERAGWSRTATCDLLFQSCRAVGVLLSAAGVAPPRSCRFVMSSPPSHSG